MAEDYAALAREAQAQGDLARAKQLFERVWDFRAAAACARAQGDRPEALRLLLDAQAFPEAAALAAGLSQADELARAAAVYERKRMWGAAAVLRERTGEFARAAELFGRAQAPLLRGRALELAGRPREAGLCYEELLGMAPEGPDAAEARVRLGRLLAAFGRHEEAVRHLQRAARAPAWRAEAERLLVRELCALGLAHGARTVLERLHAAEPEVPDTLDAFLRAEPPPARLDADDGRTVAGRYRIVRLLAAGGSGRVYLASDTLQAGTVALKIFAPPEGGRGREAYQRFVREARIVRALRHPNIVAVRDVDEGLGLLVMEYLPGGTLAERLLGGHALGPLLARRVALDVLGALEAAHQRGVVHRDLKPANILFDAAGVAKLGDFGVAHLVDAGQTQTGGLIGTLAYMSPEQVTGAPITFAGDLYALGVTLFEMLCGRLPFPGPDFVAQHLGDPAPPTGLGSAWDALCGRLLAKSPGGRFPSIDAARAALASLPTADGPAARLPAPVEKEPVAAAPAPSASASEPAAPADDGRFGGSREIASTRWSRLFTAIDSRLGRTVLLEEFAAPLGEHLARLRALARAGGPHLERVLRIDEAARRVVYEAAPGEPAPPGALSPVELLRLVQAAGRALAPLHAEGFAHGALAPAAVLFGEAGPLVRLAGLLDPERPASPADDVAATIALFAELGGAPEAVEALRDREPRSGAELAAAAAALLQQADARARSRRRLALLAASAPPDAPDEAVRALLAAEASAAGLSPDDADRAFAAAQAQRAGAISTTE